MDVIKQSLYHEWFDLILNLYRRGILRTFDISDVTVSFRKLLKEYTGLNRKYHNHQHISDMLCIHKKMKHRYDLQFEDEDAIITFIFFHDIVYSTKKDEYQNNERNSFDEAKRILNSFFEIEEDDFMTKLETLIIYSPGTYIVGESVKHAHDLDYAYFGADYPKFYQITRKIKGEYDLYTRLFLFDKYRKKFLIDLLNQQTIFKTAPFIQEYEDTARENINRYLKGEKYHEFQPMAK